MPYRARGRVTCRNVSRSKCLRTCTAVLLSVLLIGTASGQVILHSDPFASSGGAAHKNVVRDASGTLHCLSIQENSTGQRELVLHRSTDGGTSWVLDALILNDDTSGLTPPNASNGCSLAIDSTGTLHILWGNYYYPSYYEQFYRNYDPTSGSASDIVRISDLTGAALTSRTAAMEIVVDADDTVWLAGHGPSSWVEHLLRSSVPSASNLEFEDLGGISPFASAQNSRLAIDSEGRVHCSFYRNVAPGNYEHRIYDPAAGWDATTSIIGNDTPTNDFYGSLAADLLGHVHAVYVKDATDGSTWQFRYRRWESGTGWGDETLLMDVEPAQYSGIANYRIFSVACDETTGTATVVYRDLTAGGALQRAEKALADPEFILIDELAPPDASQHVYYVPTLRGSLFPESNRTSAGIHITWQNRPVQGVPPYSLVFHAPDGGPGFRRSDANGDGNFTGLVDGFFILAYQFIPGSPEPPCLDAADVDDSGTIQGLVDGVYALNFQFVPGTPPPPAPGPLDCGVDPTPDGLGCDAYPCP